MRKRRDPGIRQEAFILAATELFMEKGFEAVSVRDVLDAVADKTASPSVFYYYFPSKDALYRACVQAVGQDYLSAIREGFSPEGRTVGEWMLSLVSCMESRLLNERNLIRTGNSTPNRLFVLDMREQVTGQIVPMWTASLTGSFGVPPEEAEDLARFLSGGIGELLFGFLLEGRQDRPAVQKLSVSAVRFCMNTLGLPDMQKEQLLQVLRDMHDREERQKEEDEKNEQI